MSLAAVEQMESLATLRSAGEIIGVDLGGTKVHLGRTKQGAIVTESRHFFDAQSSESEVIQKLISYIDAHLSNSVAGIGIGVPSIVDVNRGVVYETVNIPAWREVHLQAILESHFKIPVRIDNDANCFALGEYCYGGASGFRHVVGLSLGTGMGVGLLVDGKLYQGNSGGAGELGALRYRDGAMEDYCSGRFFKRFHNTTGEDVCRKASAGNKASLDIMNEFGEHVAAALSAILLAYDPEVVVLGGSIAKAYPYFCEKMESEMRGFQFKRMWQQVRLVLSDNANSAILGAAALLRE